MKRLSAKIGITAIILACAASALSSAAFAEDPFSKLGRGIANVLTGWVEIGKGVYQTSTEQNPFAGITVGLAKGTGAALARTGAGFYEIATFPVPVPENYTSPIEPEYVF